MTDDLPSTIAGMRRDYRAGSLVRDDLDASPIRQFAKWFDQAVKSDIREPNALTLATVGLDGIPTTRTLLMKDFDERGVTIYTNYTSRKAQELEAHPKASILFFWKELERQVQVRGTVGKVTTAESEAYFFSRPYNARIGAWASRQSEHIPNREWLTNRIAEYQERFPDTGEKDCVPLPDFWGGYVVSPVSVEFWQGQPGRNHDRFIYSRPDGSGEWTLERWSP